MDEAIDCAIAEAVDAFSRSREKQRLAQAEETVGFRERFIGIVTHDLRSPLNAIVVGAATILRTENISPPVGHIAGRIVANADRMTRIMSELLDLTRGRLGGGIPVTPAPGDLGVILRESTDAIEAEYPDRKIELTATGNLQGEWDPNRVAQAITNLVSNALIHGDHDSPVRVALADWGDSVSITVANRGAPISPHDLPHVFDAFRRPAMNRSPGLGLGLFITKEIVRAHGGEISVTSTEEGGTSFDVVMPRRRPK